MKKEAPDRNKAYAAFPGLPPYYILSAVRCTLATFPAEIIQVNDRSISPGEGRWTFVFRRTFVRRLVSRSVHRNITDRAFSTGSVPGGKEVSYQKLNPAFRILEQLPNAAVPAGRPAPPGTTKKL
jgi:hypothetical protein